MAPELTGKASKSNYSQKVDMYTLGVILFEMTHRPFETVMERNKTIIALRLPETIIPEGMLSDPSHHKTVQILKWLLNHDMSKRPSAAELLASDLVPSAPLEAKEVQETLRHVLANPQSKLYKHLVARCLQQESDSTLELTYHWDLISINSRFEYVKCKVINLFKRHGAIEVDTPILTPLPKNYNRPNPVKLMTHSGGVVVLPSELRAPFARYIANSDKNIIRRYSVDRVYKEKKVFNFHPKQTFECAFDIITPSSPGNSLIDAELIQVAFSITNEIPRLKENNIYIRINHTTLLKAILMFCNVPEAKYIDLFGIFMDFIEGKLKRFQLSPEIYKLNLPSKTSVPALVDLLTVDVGLGVRGSAEGPLKSVLKARNNEEAASLARKAIDELEEIVHLVKSFGVTCTIRLCPGKYLSYKLITFTRIWILIS